ncbi:hypothetical protein [Pseudomonas protegens]|nr:hypothetical protein [Pseudomonas protegens]
MQIRVGVGEAHQWPGVPWRQAWASRGLLRRSQAWRQGTPGH